METVLVRNYCSTVQSIGAIAITPEVDGIAGVLQFDALQGIAQRLVIMANVLLVALAERQRKVRIGLLAIVIWADRVHP